MTQFSQSELQKLVSQSNSPCISLYLPTEKAGAETRKNPIRFKNLLSEAENKIAQLSVDSNLKDHLDSAKSYIENYDFWQHQDLGLVFFISPEGLQYYRLPHSFQELVIVGDRFYLKPLLPVISNNTKFYLLALSQNQVRFFWGNKFSIQELALPEQVPPSLAEALKYDDPEKQIQYHSGDSGSSPVYHGQGVGTTDNKEEIKRFFLKVDSGLQSALSEENTPLILAGVDYLLPIYQEINSYSNLVETGITGNPENLSAEDLHHQAWEIIKTQLATEKQQAIDKYYQSSETATDQLAEIIPAAVNGQVDTLFLVTDTEQWGSFETESNQVEIHSEVTANSLDLLDLASVNTYLQGGKVYLIEPERMPENKLMMAILRYPVYAKAKKVTV